MENFELILGTAIISFLVFIIYNAFIIKIFGIPKSLSESFYLMNNRREGSGYIFTAMMFIVGLYLMPSWLELGDCLSPWSHYLDPLAFATCASICFVGAAPAFRNIGVESKVHDIGAKTAAACSMTWCLSAVVGHNWWDIFIPLGVAGLVAIAGVITKTMKTCTVYWLEMMAFYATFLTVIPEIIMQTVK